MRSFRILFRSKLVTSNEALQIFGDMYTIPAVLLPFPDSITAINGPSSHLQERALFKPAFTEFYHPLPGSQCWQKMAETLSLEATLKTLQIHFSEEDNYIKRLNFSVSVAKVKPFSSRFAGNTPHE